MTQPKGEPLVVDARYWGLEAAVAIRDVFDALVELITNADDRYVLLKRKHGRIDVEVERKRKGTPSIVRVRDFADGMTIEDMRKKLARVGERVSGMADGHPVRGTYSRGAKDVAILGKATFESIAGDGKCHKCEITGRGRFVTYESVPKEGYLFLEQLRIPEGTGTVVTLHVDAQRVRIPQHDTLREELSRLVQLRDILNSPEREIILSDVNQGRSDRVRAPAIDGHERLSERFRVPNYEGAEAKVVVCRAPRPFDDQAGPRFRMGGILVKSRHAIHESTLFAPELENDQHAKWFYGRLSCEYIDQLLNDYDDRFQRDLPPTQENPLPVLDPRRKEGLTREHPFVKALFQETLKRLRPLVEIERRQAEGQQAKIENDDTRKRLRTLEKAAAKFMSENRENEEATRDTDESVPESVLQKKGYSLSPPFAQLVVGHSVQFWLQIRQEAFPELAVGDSVQISCVTDDLTADKLFDILDRHPTREGVLRCIWKIKGEKPTAATAVKVRVGPIVDESVIEVLPDERARYAHIKDFCFGKKRYSVQTDSKRSVYLYAPCPGVISTVTPIDIECPSAEFKLTGASLLTPHPDLGVAICKLALTVKEPDMRAQISARIPGHKCECDVVSLPPVGGPIKIELKDEDFGNQRSAWKSAGLLHIGARHPSLRRYLGIPPEFAGQKQGHFRVLVAEIVAEAVCTRLISLRAQESPQEYQDYDWDAYYADYTKLMTRFLPIAHETQLGI